MNTLRVFISSTFRDLQEEREYLIKKIFPEIRALCRTRGINFTEVDLRWGLTEEDVALGQVIRTCLEAVDRCRPYFIGITGDRYGYVPTFLDLQKDPWLLEQYPWIAEVSIDGMSITEMEAHYAVLREAEGGGRKAELENARFYFRRHRQSLDDDDSDSEDRNRLEAYQNRIRASNARIEAFRDPISLGELIHDDLVEIIRNNFADAKPPTPLEEERMRHAAFSLSRRRAYIANPLYLKRLNDHVASDDPPLVVYAESGSGKSSLFAHWADQYRRTHHNHHVVEHYVGIGATGSDHYAIIRHMCMEIKERFGRQEEIPSTPQDLEKSFGLWLGYADHELQKSEGKLILILDGLNQLQGEALSLLWIPDAISPSIRLFLSSTVEHTFVELKQRGWGQLGMQALTEAEREVVIVRYLGEYHKALSPQQIQQIARDYKCGHPLFLKTLLEELRLVGRHEDVERRIAPYLATTGTEDLFQSVLERIEEDNGARAVRETLSLIWLSRTGLSENELAQIGGHSRLKIAAMIAGLDYHLVPKDGRLTFFHDYLRRAVEKRYLNDEDARRSEHLRVARHFLALIEQAIRDGREIEQRVALEMAHGFASVEGWDDLAQALSSIEVFTAMHDGPARYELLRYWTEMRESHDVELLYRQSLERWRQGRSRRSNELLVLAYLAEFFRYLGRWDATERLHRERLQLAIESRDREAEALARFGIGDVLRFRGRYSESLAELESAFALQQELDARDGLSRTLGTMTFVLAMIGRNDRALKCAELCAEICHELDNLHGLANITSATGIVHFNMCDYDTALTYFRESESLSRLVGNRHDLACAVLNVGNALAGLEHLEQALARYQEAERMHQELGDRYGRSIVLGNIAIVYHRLGDVERSRACLLEQEAICRLLGDRRGLAMALGNLGNSYLAAGDKEQAVRHFEMAVDECRAIDLRYGLVTALVGLARALHAIAEEHRTGPPFLSARYGSTNGSEWPKACLEYARSAATECVRTSEEIGRRDTRDLSKSWLARIEALDGHPEPARRHLLELLDEATDDHHRADLHYFLWKLSVDPAVDHRTMACELYRAQHEAEPREYMRERLDEMESTE